MNKFRLKTQVVQCDTFEEFAKEFKLCDSDLIFTHQFLYDDYIASLNLPCHKMFQEKYGTGEPADYMVDHIFKDLADIRIDRIIAIGGGTVIDIAKLLTIKNATCTEDIYEDKIPIEREKKLIIVPTTCGTGSEMSSIAVVDIAKRKSKIGKSVDAFFADYAVLIPDLLTTLPYPIFLHCTIDALVHAMEIYVSPKSNEFNDAFCESAIRKIVSGFKEVNEKGPDVWLTRKKDYLIASCMAGAAMANTACGAVHACAMHFGSTHHVPHGEANYNFLISVFMAYAKLQPKGKISDIAALINGALGIKAAPSESFEALDKLLNSLIPRKPLREYGMKEEDIDAYVDKVIEMQQRLLTNSYVLLSKDDLKGIYRESY